MRETSSYLKQEMYYTLRKIEKFFRRIFAATVMRQNLVHLRHRMTLKVGQKLSSQ